MTSSGAGMRPPFDHDPRWHGSMAGSPSPGARTGARGSGMSLAPGPIGTLEGTVVVRGTPISATPMSDDQADLDLSTALELREDGAVLRVAGEIDLLTAPAFETALTEAL